MAIRLSAIVLMVTMTLVFTSGQSKADPSTSAPVREIASGIFVFQGAHELFTPENQGAISNAGFIIGNEFVAIVDTGGSRKFGEQLLAAVRSHTSLPIRFVINTHMHPDHVFGNAAFKGLGPEFIGHHKLTRALVSRREQYMTANKPLLGAAFDGVEIILPTVPVMDRYSIDLGGRKLVIEAHPTAHTDNDLTVYDERTSTLFMGDLLFSGHIPVVDGSIKGWLALMQELSARKLKLVVPGHGPAGMGWPEALTAQLRYLNAIAGEIREYIEQGRTLAEAAKEVGKTEEQAWALFKEFNARNVSAAFAELEWE